ncbi:Lipopolysaccharide biosynthesis protein-like protein [Methylobacterium nodulans]|uniref:Lipopolysaccharide biosynthesis protein-like protein n=1 Tax=Methylobacterium nodulans (strain LMG 21967 / CNCM I-2342 / ORS 2060) TaxID=460265 RepID=B8IAE7_METNO|nr:Lipopolysaccharide biosynthesis protein-like protein [Methylobacterium nodulans]ACL59210.1 Lipopolysaccharide biosynthesis protein-like protein [Methylobacterium nodulans ORS 2060]
MKKYFSSTIVKRKSFDCSIIESGFDKFWYLSSYEDVAAAGVDPIHHYLEYGAAEGRLPTPLFDPEWYLRAYPESARNHRLPFVDFMHEGARLGRNPHPLCDLAWFSANEEQDRGADIHPFLDFLDAVNSNSRKLHPLFDASWYTKKYPDVLTSGFPPFVHYILLGAKRRYDPHPLFDTAYYLDQFGSDIAEIDNPLVDYLYNRSNWNKSPHPLFNSSWYLAQNADVANHGLNPLRHFVQSGFSEGRKPCALFHTSWYAAHYLDGATAQLNPVVDYLCGGAEAGRNPNFVFNSNWYMLHNGDVAAAKLNPLVHYIMSGWREGRDPGPLFDSSWYQARYPETNRSDIDPLEHYLTMGLQAGYIGRPVDRITHDCDALDIPFEVIKNPASLIDKEVCLFVTYAGDGQISGHVLSHVKSFRDNGILVILVIVTEGLSRSVSPILDRVDGALVRINHGWDFAAWATALATFPDAWRARLLYLVNDSIYGPTDQALLSAVFKAIRENDKDVVALCDSYQAKHHLMSFFTALKPSGLKNDEIRSFWNGVRSNRDKQTVINEYEIRSIERLERAGVTYDVLFPARAPQTDSFVTNPTLHEWRDLISRGFPYTKVQLLRGQFDRVDPTGWEAAFSRNATLLPEIKAHLERGRGEPARWRPVPSPKQRFVQNGALMTYYGAVTSVRPADEVDLALEVPFSSIGDVGLELPERVAVIAHVFYTDFCSELSAYLARIPTQADLFISTDTEDKRQQIAFALQSYNMGKLTVRVMPNIGRDIAPMLVGFDDVFNSYEYFLHIHSKKSPHDPAFGSWREFLLENLLGSEDIIRSILYLLHAHKTGIVFSQHFEPVRHLLNFGYNFETMKGLLGRCGIKISNDLVLEFPSSSFFWGRSSALKPLLDLNLDWSDFAAEAGQIDGTLAHAIERSVLYIVEKSGFRWAKVGHRSKLPVELLVPVQGQEDVRPAIARVYRPLLHNRIAHPKEAHLVSEINLPLVRDDTNARPRLNLLVPTLQPAKIFGGLTTAIKIFEDLAVEVRDAFDLRLITVSERIDMMSMLRFPDYRLVPLASPDDGFPKVVVDASERQRGYLSLRRNDIFIATAWWTAQVAYHLQDRQHSLYGKRLPVVYLVQDHEPDFYGWSSQYAQAQDTYLRPHETITLLNSEELASFHMQKYQFGEAFAIPFQLNPAIAASLTSAPKERIILVYGRPGTARNCFGIAMQALKLWQRSDPVQAAQWKIVSAGEDYDPFAVSQVRNLEVRGKLSLAEYGGLLSRASVGISLMASPHPSYPPLEMACAGVRTITNAFDGKNLSLRSANIVSVERLSADEIAERLAAVVRDASSVIGNVLPTSEVNAVQCPVPPYAPRHLAQRLMREVEPG